MRRFHLKRVDRLVAMAVLGAVLLTWAVVVSLDAFRVFVSELDDVGTGDYTLAKAAVYVLMTVPRRVYEMFGYAALIGSLLGLGGLAHSGELTALRAAGLSKLRISASVALGLGVITLLVVVLGETLAPVGDRRAQALLLSAKSSDVALARGGTLWARDGENVIGARRARAQGPGRVDLFGVRVFEFAPDGRLTALSVAAEARYAEGAWTLREVRRTEFGAHAATTREQASQHWQSSLDPGLLAGSIVRPQYMGLAELGRNIRWLQRNQQDAGVFRRAWWERVFYPVNVLVLAFSAVPFAFGALRSGGLSKRLFIGIVGALGFYFLQRAMVNFGAVYGVHPAIANLVPPLLLATVAWAYFRRHA
jgi:lipopolysaccharide export system permease protein